MDGASLSQRTAQLDKAEREHLEDVVTEMRERVEDNVEYQLRQQGLDEEPDESDSLDEDAQQLVKAIELEAVDGHTWEEAFEEYVTGVGYTIVNRLSALRCMEVRDFIDEEVTVFKDNGLTPAAETLVNEEFLMENEAILEAYHNACDELAEEIEILFDRSTPYSLIDPDDDTFEELCGMLDSVPDEVWRADDVLGWVYEYYNVKLLDDLRKKGSYKGFSPEDVPPANQFYTPHWVVRMLTDNSLGKLYLEHKGILEDTVEQQSLLTAEERKNRPLSPDKASNIGEFCTYLVPSQEEGEAPSFNSPAEIRVIDPACGSGHFLLYAFDILERIWRLETDINHADIPRKILQENLYGVDLDMRACQLAAFSLYLKGRMRAEAEGADEFDMPDVGIVCADAKIADMKGVGSVFEEVSEGDSEVKEALQQILDAFEETHGLGSLLDVQGTLADLFEDDDDSGTIQIRLNEDLRENHTLSQTLRSLREAIGQHRNSDSFLAQDLRSFIRLLEVLSQDYDVALMNPPYGSRNRMPNSVQNYIEDRYEYPAEFYINFFEMADRVTKSNGRIGMLIPWTLMFKQKFEEFREDFVGERGAFDFLAEFGYGILDNAKVGTVGTVVRSGTNRVSETGSFLRLHNVPTKEKEEKFTNALSLEEQNVKRYFEVELNEFTEVPGTTICYSIPSEVRALHDTDVRLDAEQAGEQEESIGVARQGVATANDDRFTRFYWETTDFDTYKPIANGGEDAWLVPEVEEVVEWGENGTTVKRFSQTVRTPNEHLYNKEGLTWTRIKQTGRRFGYYPGGIFSATGYLFVPDPEHSLWTLLGVINSDLYYTLFLSLTLEREWNSGEVGGIPWYNQLENVDAIREYSQTQYRLRLLDETENPTSRYYMGPSLLPAHSREFFFEHPHQDISLIQTAELTSIEAAETIEDAAREAEMKRLEKQQQIESLASQIDNLIYERLEISEKTRSQITEEIFLRTSESPENREIPDPESVPETPGNIDQQVKQLVHHFALEAVREVQGGIIPLHNTDTQADMLDRIVERFEDTYGEYAENRLIKVDNVLGTKSAAEEAYPNLRAFIEDDLFDYHIEKMENTPILWRFTTERLIADSTGEGFACFLDYHSLDAGLFDRLTNQYLEPRKAELRERRSAANRRRSDDSLSTSEQAEAAEQYKRCASGLDQISVFEDVLQELGNTDERDFDDEGRQRVKELAPKVAAFREETRKRVDTLAELRERKGEAWFQETFSDNFWNAVDEWREEWVDALEELEYACEEYAKPVDEPVEAHLADLFDYFNWRLKGSDHYSSSGILFMTYYFEREGADLLNEDGQPFDTLAEDERLLASLATGLDDPSIVDEEYLEASADDEGVEKVDALPPLAEFKALAEEIDDRCQTVDKRISSNWTARALSEITTAGYQPNHKHGVEINIRPLADAEIVPKTVDDQVL
jgi:hypothetical protein